MPTGITVKGQVTIPKKVREALRLSPGDAVEFELSDHGRVIVHKPQLPAPDSTRRQRGPHPQIRRRAAELLELLRGLD
jgi:AbrB family looped-hinge helix DNA binding protein